jgi:hypothetical protein
MRARCLLRDLTRMISAQRSHLFSVQAPVRGVPQAMHRPAAFRFA